MYQLPSIYCTAAESIKMVVVSDHDGDNNHNTQNSNCHVLLQKFELESRELFCADIFALVHKTIN